MCLSEAARNELPKLGYQLCNIYQKLAREAFDNREQMWKWAPKLHAFLHLTEWQCADFGNPRFWWTYPDEDLVGHIIEVAKTTHKHTMAPKSLFKWLTFYSTTCSAFRATMLLRM